MSQKHLTAAEQRVMDEALMGSATSPQQDITARLKNVPSLLHLSLEDWAEQQGAVRRDAIAEITRLRTEVAAKDAQIAALLRVKEAAVNALDVMHECRPFAELRGAVDAYEKEHSDGS